MSARKVQPEIEVRETRDLGPLADSKKSGILFREGDPDHSFNRTCPDWCETIGRHVRDSTEQSAHWSPLVYAPLVGMKGYWTKQGSPCEAHVALNLVRRDRHAEPEIVIHRRSGSEDGARVNVEMGALSLDGARQLVDCLQVLIAAAEAES